MADATAGPTGPPASLRVLLVLGTSGGGVGRHVCALAASLVAAGHQVTVAGPAQTGVDFGFAQVGGRFEPVEMRDRPHPREDALAVRDVRALAERADVVHAHGLRAGGFAVLALRRRRTPLVVTLHNALLARGVTGSPVRAAYAVLERLVARGADVLLGVSPDLEARLRELGGRDVRHAVVPAPSAARPVRTAQATRAALGGVGVPLVVCVARLAEQKGLRQLLDAVALLGAHRPPGAPTPCVVVAGDGPLRERLQNRIDAEGLPVRLLGWRDDVADLLAAADVVVSSAVWEGQPIAVQQALQAGAAVVATDVGGTAAVTGDAAVLVAANDAPGLATQIARLLDDPGERSRLAARARIRAAELPTDDDARDAALAIYRQLVGSRAAT